MMGSSRLPLAKLPPRACPGMSTFSTKGGLYERAQRRYGVSDGKKLFTYSFFEKQRLPALVWACASVLAPTPDPYTVACSLC